MKRTPLFAAALCLQLLSPATAGAETEAPRRLTLEGAVDIALADNPALVASQKAVAGAKARVSSSRALRLPQLSAEANVFFWDSAIELELVDPTMPLPPGMEAPSAIVRDRITAAFTATLAQPLSAQFAIGRLIAVDEAGLDATRLDDEATRLQVGARAAESYLRLLQAMAGADIAGAAVKQIESQLERARLLRQGGVLEKVDVMRLEAALAGARQQEIVAQKAVLAAQQGLALVLDLPLHTAFEVADTLPEEPPPPPLEVAEAAAAALERPGLKAARRRADQAEGGADVALARLYPELSAVASFQHNEGGGEFSPENVGFVGLTLSWNVWNWGHDWYAYKAASADAARARVQTDLAERGALLQVRQAALDARAAHQAIEAARAGLAAAEEAYRIQRIRFAEGATTTTDLLAAEIEVSRARLSYAGARYEYYVALVDLARVTGNLPTDLLPPRR